MHIRTTRNSVITACVFSVLSGMSAVGTAHIPAVSIQSMRVSYADLNLNKADDAQTLYTRLRRTAENVCEDNRRKSLREMIDERECKTFALDKAVKDVGNQKLTTIHQS
jgi:UrcA family protein